MRKLPVYEYMGWLIKRNPNSFSEASVWSAVLLDEEGYVKESYGFRSKREAESFVDSEYLALCF